MSDGDKIDLIEGLLDQIVYVNEQSGYTVARVEIAGAEENREHISVIGNFGGCEIAATLRLHGQFEVHPRYGRQFRATEIEVLRPADVAAIERYLAAGEIRGVGPRLAHRIAEHFGDRLPEILEHEPARLREVRGLGAVVVARIAAAWKDASGLREISVFLRGHGISAAYARRIHKVYGARSLETVRKDPYILARTIPGIGFRTADAVAERIGIARDSIERARAAALYLLERMAEEGHVYAPLAYLRTRFESALGLDQEVADQAVCELRASGEVVVEKLGEDEAVYLKRLYEAEVNVARRIRALSAGQPIDNGKVEQALAKATEKRQVLLSVEQQAALRCALRSKVAVITGGPGTGKTTLLRSLLAMLADIGIRPMLAAPTGRAARRLAETTMRDAKTIHRLLEYSPETGEFVRNSALPLRTNFLIVDETSMMDLELASSLLDALIPQASLVLVGDRDQLPSVGAGSVLKDIIASGLVPVIELHEVYRQARDSTIIANAHRINQGQMPQTNNESSADFFFLERAAPEDIVATIKQLLTERLAGKFGVRDAGDIQVITPMNRGPIGVHALNAELQRLLNPVGPELRSNERIFRTGDRVIQLRNNYDKLVFNGDIGRVVEVDPQRRRLDIAFDENLAVYDAGDLGELALAYAISVHKSQGSQYPAVVMPIHQSHYVMLRRNLLYTAITRAERVAVLVGTRTALQQAVRNEEERRRFSRLAGRLHID